MNTQIKKAFSFFGLAIFISALYAPMINANPCNLIKNEKDCNKTTVQDRKETPGNKLCSYPCHWYPVPDPVDHANCHKVQEKRVCPK